MSECVYARQMVPWVSLMRPCRIPHRAGWLHVLCTGLDLWMGPAREEILLTRRLGMARIRCQVILLRRLLVIIRLVVYYLLSVQRSLPWYFFSRGQACRPCTCKSTSSRRSLDLGFHKGSGCYTRTSKAQEKKARKLTAIA